MDVSLTLRFFYFLRFGNESENEDTFWEASGLDRTLFLDMNACCIYGFFDVISYWVKVSIGDEANLSRVEWLVYETRYIYAGDRKG